MENNKSYNSIYLIAGIILIGIFSRIIPHAPNFTAIGAIALFGGAYIKHQTLRYTIPLIAMLLSDILLYFLGAPFPSLILHLSIYGAFVLIVSMGAKFIKLNNPNSIVLTSLGASTLFFFLSNFGVWLNGFYGYTLTGFINCYIMAIPFFGNTIAGDMIYCAIFFGAYEYIKISLPSIARK